MRPQSVSGVITLALSLFFGVFANAQSIGIKSSAIWVTDCIQSNFYNATGTGSDLIGPVSNDYNNFNFGSHTQNSGTLILRGGQVRTFGNTATSNVCTATMYYRIYPASGTPGSFVSIDLPLIDDCNGSSGNYASGGSCADGDQKWSRIIPDGSTVPYAPVNLTAFAAGQYVLEVYFEITGSSVSASLCDETIQENNGGNFFKAYFSIDSPDLSSTNPTTCNGSQGSITISGLTPGTEYAVTWSDDGNLMGPLNLTANASGQVTITGLNAGIYADFALTVNGCISYLNTGVILSNPVYTPTFTPIPPFCAGSTPPVLPSTSNNGLTGSWSPAVVNNMSSGTYTFTPDAGQCGIPVIRNIIVQQNTTPTFSFGTSLTICDGEAVPVLPSTSNNGISGTWSPAVVDPNNSGVYTFTPAAGICATSTSFSVTVNPNVQPVFAFGTVIDICENASAPALPVTSQNGLTGTWSPAVIDNLSSGTYTFTPDAGQCGLPFVLQVNVTPNTIPVFSFGPALSLCEGATAPALPATSDNGIAGSWSPATIDNQNSGNYTFTPAAGICALPYTLQVTVDPNITPSFDFGTSLTICEGGSVPALPASSTNGITGSWSPATADNTQSGTYTFTPDAGQCALQTSFTITVNPNVTPTFSFGTSMEICEGSSAPVLPNTSTNGIAGSWSPATVSNTTSGTYTFTPAAGLCALPVQFTVTVNANVIPVFSFGNSMTICSGAGVPTLPATSDNGVAGTWSPATVSNTSSGTYTFTPAAGSCALPFNFSVTVNPNVQPQFDFGSSLTICAGETVPVLPNLSQNGISGSWSPSVVDNTTSGTYTFTPDAGVCALTATFSVNVNPVVTPAFGFGTSMSICAGDGVPGLPSVSDNGIQGTWSPATIDNQASGNYTFTPANGTCANAVVLQVTVTPNEIPVFGFGSALTICAGGTVPVLPSTSDNGIAGNWSPAVVDNNQSAVYTFTPAPGICATTYIFTVTVNPNITPAFSFGTSMSICEGGTVPVLGNTSSNGITGTWSPAVVDNTQSGTYTFTPDAGQCAVATSFTLTVNANTTPVFAIGNSISICAGASVPSLPATSDNGIAGAWSPAQINNQASGVYTFTPATGTCATTVTFTVNVTQNIIPVFSFGTGMVICTGGSVPALPSVSDNGISGSWNPAVVNNNASGVYVFIPDPVPGQCIAPASFILTVNQFETPVFDMASAFTICSGASVPQLPTTSTNGISGSWSPATISNTQSGTYTFTPSAGQCAAGTATIEVTVIPVATAHSFMNDTTVNDGALVPGNIISGNPAGVSFTWTNSNPAIGLPASGTGNIPSFTAVNPGNDPVSGTITITPTINGCAGNAITYIITVNPLIKDVFVPNVFSPNADGRNDLLKVYGNYIVKLDMRIFNQWGEQVERITDKNKGWDGRHQGKAQPVGVYAYALEAVLTDGRTVRLKGYITLLR